MKQENKDTPAKCLLTFSNGEQLEVFSYFINPKLENSKQDDSILYLRDGKGVLLVFDKNEQKMFSNFSIGFDVDLFIFRPLKKYMKIIEILTLSNDNNVIIVPKPAKYFMFLKSDLSKKNGLSIGDRIIDLREI